MKQLRERYQQLLDQKRSILHEQISLEEKQRKFENFVEDEEKYQNHLQQDLKKFSHHAFLLKTEVIHLHQSEKQYDNDHQMLLNQIRHRKHQIHQLDQQLYKQQELIYHQDFTKQAIDRRLNRLLGEKKTDPSSELELKRRQLKKDLEERKVHFEQLQTQIKQLRDDLRLIKRDKECLIREKSELQEKFLQFDLYETLSEKSIRQWTNRKEVKEALLSGFSSFGSNFI